MEYTKQFIDNAVEIFIAGAEKPFLRQPFNPEDRTPWNSEAEALEWADLAIAEKEQAIMDRLAAQTADSDDIIS